jgi:hypothetical protein
MLAFHMQQGRQGQQRNSLTQYTAKLFGSQGPAVDILSSDVTTRHGQDRKLPERRRRPVNRQSSLLRLFDLSSIRSPGDSAWSPTTRMLRLQQCLPVHCKEWEVRLLPACQRR